MNKVNLNDFNLEAAERQRVIESVFRSRETEEISFDYLSNFYFIPSTTSEEALSRMSLKAEDIAFQN